MRPAAVVLAALALAAPTAQASAAVPWRTYRDAAGGYSIAVPARWQVVPRSDAALRQLVARLRKTHERALADQLAAAGAARAKARAAFRFQAFEWPPPPGPVVPDVTVKTDRLAPGSKPDVLAKIAAEYVRSLGAGKGTRVAPALRVALAAGPAYRVSGTAQVAKSLRSGFVVYLLVHADRLWSLSFRASAARAAADGALYRRIAGGFRFA